MVIDVGYFICLFQHAYRDGSLEQVALRHLDAEDGNIVIAKNIRFILFISHSHSITVVIVVHFLIQASASCHLSQAFRLSGPITYIGRVVLL